MQDWLAAVCKCAVLCGGVSLSLHGEKKQNKSPSNCTTLSAEYLSNQFVFYNYFNFFYRINVSSWCFSTLAYNGLAILSKGFQSTSVSIYYKFLLLALSFNLPLKPLLGMAFVTCWHSFTNLVIMLKSIDIYHI